MLAADEVGDHPALQRSGTVQGQKGDNVLEAIGAQVGEYIAHAGTFQLKHAVRLPPGQQGECLRVVQGQGVHVRDGLAPFFGQLQGIAYDRERLQPQKIELDQPDLFHPFHVVLGDHFPLFPAIQGEIFLHGLVRNHNPRGMGGSVPGQALQAPGDVHELADVFLFSQLAQIRLLFQGLVYGHLGIIRNELGDLVHQTEL